jgi:hypothetical protein
LKPAALATDICQFATFASPPTNQQAQAWCCAFVELVPGRPVLDCAGIPAAVVRP